MADTTNDTPTNDTTKNAATPATRVDRPAGTNASADAAQTTNGGSTTIADHVVAKVAGIAAREVRGVHALGGGGARAFGAIRDAVNATDLTQGVKVEVGQTQAAADLTIVVEYPMPIHSVAAEVRSTVAGAITRLTGLEVVEVNIEVNDIHVPGEDDEDDDTEARVA
ncbi:Asp23/Gls24 family envelope stress response protein [Microbacterium sp. NPDC077184]|uniref:Asp23/Gls24 family envelope stress response protein n=1 Tax=Microbacterium sp. NPDC077184 TaxID=3154764 RepID=UPI00342B70DE